MLEITAHIQKKEKGYLTTNDEPNVHRSRPPQIQATIWIDDG